MGIDELFLEIAVELLDMLVISLDGSDWERHRYFELLEKSLTLALPARLYIGEGRVPNCAIVHYTRKEPLSSNQDLSAHFDWRRIIRPAGGGERQDSFSSINRHKYSNEDLLQEAKRCLAR